MVEDIEELDLTPPEAAQQNAQKVLEWRDSHEEEVTGMTRDDWVRANQIANGESLAPEVIEEMAGFDKHRGNSSLDDEHDDAPWKDANHTLYKGWGGDEGVDWAMRMDERMNTIQETGRDTITTLSHKHPEEDSEETTVENQDFFSNLKGGSEDESKRISKNTYKGYFEEVDVENEDFEDAVDRLNEVYGMTRSFITHIVNYEASGNGREDNVPVFEEPVDSDTLDKFIENVEENVEDDDTFVELVSTVHELDELVRYLFYYMVKHDNESVDREDVDVEQLLSDELEYDTVSECVSYHVEQGYDQDQAFAMCADKMALEDQENLRKGKIPTHRPLGDYDTLDSEDKSGYRYSDFAESYGLEGGFADLDKDDKRLVAAHFGRVDNSSLEDATYSDLQMPHHDPETGAVDRASVVAARQRLKQADMPQEDLEAIDTHLTKHMREDFGEEDVSPLVEKSNALEREDVYATAEEALERAYELGLTGLHTLNEGDDTFFMPGTTHEEYENEVRTEEDRIDEGQLVSFETEFGKRFGRVKQRNGDDYHVEIYSAQLGGGWKMSGKLRKLSDSDLMEEDKLPESLDDVFNSGGSSVEAETVEENDSRDDELGEEETEEMSDEGEDGDSEELTQKVEPSELQQVKKKSET